VEAEGKKSIRQCREQQMLSYVIVSGGAGRMDLEYIDKWSLWLDFKILLRTIPAVISEKGAY